MGISGEANGWNIDFSNTFGQNQLLFRSFFNASLLRASPTTFNAGGRKFTQNTINFDVNRNFDVLAGINIAFGAEYRFERYQLLPAYPN